MQWEEWPIHHRCHFFPLIRRDQETRQVVDTKISPPTVVPKCHQGWWTLLLPDQSQPKLHAASHIHKSKSQSTFHCNRPTFSLPFLSKHEVGQENISKKYCVAWPEVLSMCTRWSVGEEERWKLKQIVFHRKANNWILNCTLLAKYFKSNFPPHKFCSPLLGRKWQQSMNWSFWACVG